MWTINKLLILGCAGSLLLRGLFSSGGEWVLCFNCGAQASHRGGFSCCRAQAVGHSDLSSCGMWALELRLNSVVVAHKLSYPALCGMSPYPGSNPHLLHWQVILYH